MEKLEDFAFKLVCVDETNPLEYEVLEDVNAKDLDEVHKQISEKICKHNIATTKWMLLPIKKIRIG